MRFRLAALLTMALALQGLARAQAPLPYRFLLVIGDQWKDPSSYIIEDGGEFQIMAALLKSGGCHSTFCGWISSVSTSTICWTGMAARAMAPSSGTRAPADCKTRY